jgi:hypothetical protein
MNCALRTERAGLAQSPGPRAWDLGLAAWRRVRFARDEKCQAIGLRPGVAERARRFRLLLGAYGVEPDIGIVLAGIERMQNFLDHYAVRVYHM